jgi:hypothetical protein
MRRAFKEWAVIVDALGRGDQILILRKGGIAEGGGGFRIEHTEFFLFPTLFHQQRESVLEAGRERFDQILPLYHDTATVRIEFFARVAAWRRLDNLGDAERLRGQHIWRDDVIARRFEWGRDPSIYAMAVRVFRLPQPVILPASPSYGGCKSWVDLEADLEIAEAIPVVNDAAFDARLRQFESAVSPAEVES